MMEPRMYVVARDPSSPCCDPLQSASRLCRQRGAALLAAMLTVTLVASFAATALWQQWQAVEIETAERSRVQAAWILVGALDWASLILVEDSKAGRRNGVDGPDHLGEPWAIALQETRLSSFLAADKNNTAGNSSDNQLEVFLSGQIEDMQSRLNVNNLIVGGKVSPPDLAAFGKLFSTLALPQAELLNLADKLLAATSNPAAAGTLLPQRVEQLAWLGMSQGSLARLLPYISLLKPYTTVNLNTASAEVIYASIPDIEMAQAQRIVDQRALSPLQKIDDASRLLGGAPDRIPAARHSVSTRFFEVRGKLRLEQTVIEERSLLERKSDNTIQTLWRERTSASPISPNPPAGTPAPRVARQEARRWQVGLALTAMPAAGLQLPSSLKAMLRTAVSDFAPRLNAAS